MGGWIDLQGAVESEDDFGAGGKFLLAIVLEPPDSGDSGAYTQADDCAYAATDNGSGDYGAGGGEADGCSRGSGMDVADDGAFAVDVGVVEVVEVRDVAVDFIGGAVGEADAVWLEADGGGAGDAAASVDLADATVDDASLRQKNDAVAADVRGEGCGEP